MSLTVPSFSPPCKTKHPGNAEREPRAFDFLAGKPCVGLSVDDFSVLVLVGREVFGVLVHGAKAHAHGGEATVMEKILHGDFTGKV